MNINVKEELRNTPTRQLLGLLSTARACGGRFDPTEYGEYFITTGDIKLELSTREHIPNKKEARILRQCRAKYKLGKEAAENAKKR